MCSVFRDEDVSGILSFCYCGKMKTLREFGGDVLDAMHREINSPVHQCLLNLLNKEAFTSNLRQRRILNLISCGLGFDEGHLKMGMGLQQSLPHPIGLVKGELTSTGSNSEFL